MDRQAALRDAEQVARDLDLRWGRVEFDVANGRVHSIERKDRVDERDEHVELREGR